MDKNEKQIFFFHQYKPNINKSNSMNMFITAAYKINSFYCVAVRDECTQWHGSGCRRAA